MDGDYRIRFDGLALNGRATVLLENARIYSIEGEGQYDLAGRYRHGGGGAIEIELEVHLPGGTLDVSKARLRPQPEVVALKFALSDEAQRQVGRKRLSQIAPECPKFRSRSSLIPRESAPAKCAGALLRVLPDFSRVPLIAVARKLESESQLQNLTE